jgi:hypothetical protein
MAFGDTRGEVTFFFDGFGDSFGVFLALDSGSSFADFLSGFLGEDLESIRLSWGMKFL